MNLTQYVRGIGIGPSPIMYIFGFWLHTPQMRGREHWKNAFRLRIYWRLYHIYCTYRTRDNYRYYHYHYFRYQG